MQLAHDLHMTRAKLLSEIDSRELTDQLAYYILKNKKRKAPLENKKEVTLQDKFKDIMGSRIIKVKKKVGKK